jgi:hypothetical protein
LSDHSTLTPDQIERLLEWQGYGNPSGRFWFIGMEEGGTPPLVELQARADLWQKVEDLADAPRPWEHNFDLTKSITSVWDGIIRIVGGLSGEPEWMSSSFVRDYQARKLGRRSGDTFLTEVLPLPKRSVGDWPYESLWKQKKDYEAAVRPERMTMLSGLHQRYGPQFTFCYGKSNWAYYRQIFPAVEFKPLVDGHLELGQVGDSNIVLMQHFSAWGFTNKAIALIVESLRQSK